MPKLHYRLQTKDYRNIYIFFLKKSKKKVNLQSSNSGFNSVLRSSVPQFSIFHKSLDSVHMLIILRSVC